MKYKFKKDTRWQSKIDVNELVNFLKAYMPENKFKPHDIIELATPKNSPIHHLFEWDDKIAGEKWRLQEARFLISCIYIENDDQQEMRAYESVYIAEKDDRFYTSIEQITETPELVDQVVSNALQEIEYWQLKYKNLQEHFNEIFNAIDKTKEALSEKETSSTKSRRGNSDTDTADRNLNRKNNNRRRQSASSL